MTICLNTLNVCHGNESGHGHAGSNVFGYCGYAWRLLVQWVGEPV